ncbi:helix-turn-helix domain-containing protein [Aquimarina longa]|uniref:helix-turn-helix domain-containing protein n=1 Tax=Aquimarina longa TaxID=1080221 RepID=UPI000782C407|nr:helix-turn-helix domain-containing protein [Aquimarina longa]
MFKFFCFLPLLLFTYSSLIAQVETDSLQQKSYDELLNLYNHYYETDSYLSKKMIIKYLKKAKKNRDTFHIAEAYYHLYNTTDNQYKLNYADSIIDLTKFTQNKDFPARGYFRKAQFFLFEKRDIKQALLFLNTSRELAKKNSNTKLLYRIEYYIGIIQSEHLDEKEKAIQIFKKCANFYHNKTEGKYASRYLYTLYAIAETYIGLKKYDSATYYNMSGYDKAFKSTNPNLNSIKTYFTLCEGINQYNQENYAATIDSIDIALPKIVEDKDKSNTIDSYFYLGKSYYNLNNKEKAIFYFKKTDSILETLNSIPQYKHIKTYEYLKEYYKKIDDIQNQNIYLNKLNSVLDQYLKDRVFISRKVKEDYDIPLLLEEQEKLIKKLNKKEETYISSIILLGIILIISIGLIYYQYRKKRVYRSRFEKLIKKQTTIIKTTNDIKVVSSDKTIQVPEKHITDIITKLKEFETQQRYLTPGISSQSLANEMNTNVKYLSRVINHYKNKTFTSYLNELRVTYAINELKENQTLRKYTIKAIAHEMGYKSAETFSNAFYRQVGIKPSYYIKNIEKTDKV